MKKRALSWLLALTMLLTLAPQTLPVWASATGEKSNTATQTESKLSANTYSALGLSRNVADSEKPKDQPYGKAEVGNTIATNVINELYVNFNGSIHYGWSILDNIPMEYRDDCEGNWTNSRNFYGAMGYWRPNQQTVNYGSGSSSNGALFAENGSKTGGVHNDHLGKSINSANKHLTYQYSKSEAFSPNTGKDNYVAEMVLDTDNNVWLYIYQVEDGNKRYVRGVKVGTDSSAGNKSTVIWNWEYDAMYDIAAGDMDGDGYDEIAVYASNKVYVYSYKKNSATDTNLTLGLVATKETATPTFNKTLEDKYKKLGTAVVTLAFGDLNADDKDELVIAENIGYGANNIETGKVGIYSLTSNKTLHEEKIISLKYNDQAMVRYSNVATGDIDNDYKDELIIAGYISANALGQAVMGKDTVAYRVVDGTDTGYTVGDWKTTSFVKKDLLGRVVDNTSQLIPPVSLTCAATQGVGHAEQIFLAGCLYSYSSNDGNLTKLTEMSTNREYKKDNGSKANKEEIFVVNVVAGNFNGNRNGQEQIVYAFGMKHDDSDRYWYDIGYINKKQPGPTNAGQPSGYWYGQEQVMNYESSYNRDSSKARASLYLSLAAVDCDDDSTLMRYKGQTVTWTKPEVLTVLQSAPYFQDLQDTRDYLNQGQTAYGKGSSSGTSGTAGGSLKLGTYVSFEQDFSVFGVKVASIEAEAQSTHAFTYDYEHTKTKELNITYSGSAGDDYAVVYAVPYMEYQYETWVPGYKLPDNRDEYNKYLDEYIRNTRGKNKVDSDNNASASITITQADRDKVATELGIGPGTEVKGSWQPSSVMVPMDPAKVILSVDDYDAIAEQTEGLEPIRGNILNSTPGDPLTYDGENVNKGFTAIGDWQTMTKAEGTNISLESSTTVSEEHTFAYNYEFEAKAGAGAGGVTVGVLAGFGTSAGGGVSTSNSTSYSATVDNLPKDADGYTLSWQFGYRTAKLNNNDVLVLEYRQKNAHAKPSLPQNLRVNSVTANSVTLSWDPVVGSGAYDIYQVSTTDSNTKYLRARVPGTAESYTDTRVTPGSSYTYCVKNITQAGEESIYSTNVVATTLTDTNGKFVINQQPESKITTYAGGTTTATIDAEYLDKNGDPQTLDYFWERYDSATKTWKYIGKGTTLSVSVPSNEKQADAMDGTKYRCQVFYNSNLYIYSEPVTLTIGKANSATTLTSDNTSPTVNASYVKTETVETSEQADVPVTETKDNKTYTKYKVKDDTTEKIVYIDEDGKYYTSNNGTVGSLITPDETNVQLTYAVKTTKTVGGVATTEVDIKTIQFSSLTKQTPTEGETITYTSKDEDGTSITTYADCTVLAKYTDASNATTVYKCSTTVTDETTQENTTITFWFVQIKSGETVTQYPADIGTKTTITLDGTPVDLDDLEQVTQKENVKKEVQTYVKGTEVTLTASLKDNNTGEPILADNDKVVFKIVNSVGDGSATVTATATNGTATATWTPTAAGVYTITAEYEGNEKYMGSVSSQTITINVVVPEQKTLMIDSKNSMTYGDAAIELKTTLLKGAKNSESASVETNLNGVTYAVKNADGTAVLITGSTFDPTAAGTYTVTATYTSGSETLTATKSIVVNKRTVTIVPKVDKDTKNTSFEPVGIANDTDKALFSLKTTDNQNGNVDISCAGITATAAGEYRITVTYTATPAIDKNYIVVCDNTQVYEIKDNVVKVTNATNDANGTVTLKYSLKDNNDMVDVYGIPAYILKESKLIAVASPNRGYKLKNWIINNQPVYLNGNSGAFDTRLTYTVSESLDKEYTVKAEFEPVYYKLSFGVEGGSTNGTITANYWNGTTTDGIFQNGGKLSPLESVQLTANMSGKAIKGWKITRGTTEEIVQVNGKNYTGASYILSNISADTTVTVLTDEATSCPVTISLVDADGNPLVNEDATVSFGNTILRSEDGTYTYDKARKHDNLTVTLTLPAGLIVEEWRDSTGKVLTDGNLSNDKKTWTISDLSKSYAWTVKCSTANTFQITTETKLQGDTSEGAGATAGTISVYRAGQSEETGKINSGDKVLQATSLRVVVEPKPGYQLLSVTCNGKEKGTTGDFTINGVNKNIIIVATFVKKPVVTIENADTTKGTVTVTGTKDGVANTEIKSGSYVDYNTRLAITVKPEKGYEVTALKNGDNTFVLGGTTTDDKMAETSELTGNVTLTPTFEEIPHKTVTISVVDKNNETAGGFDGSVTASVTRKGMKTYAEDKTANSTTSTQTLTVYRDSVVTLSAQADNGYVAKWIYDGQESLMSPTLDFSTTDTLKDHEVKVRFDPIGKAITFTKDGEINHASDITGTFKPSTGEEASFASGSIPNTNGTLTLSVTPDAGYEVEDWYVNGTKQENSAGETTFAYSVTHDVGATIQVKIIRSSYKVEFSAENGSITASPTIPSGKMVRGDTVVTFIASPAQPTGYTFAGWKINGETADQYNEATANDQTLSIVIKEPVTVVATYTQDVTRHTVTYGVNGEALGTLNTNLSASPATIANGEKATFTATPKDGNYVVGWYSDAACTQKVSETGEETSYSVNVYNDTTVYVKFAAKPTYTISLAKNGSGKVFASVNDAAETEVSDSLSVKYHDKVVLRATAGANDYFAGWQDNTTGTYTIADVISDTSVTATFAPMQNVYLNAYSTDTTKGTLTATGSVSGSIQTNAGGNGVQVAGGQKITLTANPASGQMVKEWKINDQKVEGNLSNTLVIDSIKATTKVSVEFEDYVGYLIPTTPTPAKGYTVTTVERIPDDTPKDGKIRQGGTVTFTVVPDSDKVFNQLKVGNVDCLSTPSTGNVIAVREGNGYRITISNVTGEINLTATAIEFQVIKEELTQVPEGLQEKYATPEAMKSALRTQISSSVSGSNIKYLDIKLQIKDATGKWQDVTADNFPKGGINITISYGTLGNGLDKSYNYSVAHMRTDGTIENLPATNGESGITFHVNSLSPFAIGWYKASGPSGGGGGGGGGGAVSTYTLTFDTNGGSAIDKITKDSGTTIDLAAYKPTRAGYTFAGWFSDKALTKAVTSVKLTANTTVYAKWTQNGGTAQNPFVDVKEGAYYYDAVLWAVEQKITSGTSATTFSPDASCTRAQMVTFLWRAAGSPKVENGKNPFTDVKADAYYYDAVLWAVEKGVTSGTSATTFSPDATVTRGQTVTFLYRNAGSPEVSGTMPFTDVEADAYYAKAVQWAVQQKITTGTSETTFSPMSDCTRGQIVTFLYRAK